MSKSKSPRKKKPVSRIKTHRTLIEILDPRRTPGAVVEFPGAGPFAVVGAGEGLTQRSLDAEPSCATAGAPGYVRTSDGDVFVRWMNEEECRRHQVPYVPRDADGNPIPDDAPDLAEMQREIRALREDNKRLHDSVADLLLTKKTPPPHDGYDLVELRQTLVERLQDHGGYSARFIERQRAATVCLENLLSFVKTAAAYHDGDIGPHHDNPAEAEAARKVLDEIAALD